jgi:hypothetical protein
MVPPLAHCEQELNGAASHKQVAYYGRRIAHLSENMSVEGAGCLIALS